MRHFLPALLCLLLLHPSSVLSQGDAQTATPAPMVGEESLSELLAAAVLALSEDHPAEAAELFEAASRRAPEDPRPWLGQSRVAERQGDLLAALQHTRQAYRLVPEDADVGLELGRLLTRLGTVGEALQVYAEVRRVAPQRSDAYFLPAMILRDVGQHEASLELLESARRAGAGAPRLDEELALRYLALGRQAEALDLGQALLAADEERPLAHLVAGLALAADAAQASQARHHLERAISLGVPNDGRVHLELGILLLAEGQAEEALVHLQTARDALPETPEVYYRLAAVQRALGDEDAAQEALQRFQALSQQQDDADHHNKELGAALNGIQELASNNQLTAARQGLQTLLTENPQSHRGHALMAKIQFSSGLLEEAAASIQQARQLAPREAEYHFLEGYFAAHRRQPELARQALGRALALNDALPEAHGLLAVLQAQNGQPQPAAEHFARALTLGLDNADLRRHYAEVLDTLGRHDEAEAQRTAAGPG